MRTPIHLFALTALSAIITFGACNCGGGVPVGGACSVDAPCEASLVCVDGVCAPGDGTKGDGGPNGEKNDGGDGGPGDSGRPCMNLECQQVSCPAGGSTTVRGTVYAPNGTLPLYNALVYVPNGAVTAFPTGVSCDRCGDTVTGAPLVEATTRADGTFTLTNVPAGQDIPLVVQMGRWRRQVTLPRVTACETIDLDPQLSRLPKNQAEGDIPQMAIATGDADPFECLLRKVGIDDAEFTSPTGTGRVHYYRVNGKDMSPPAPTGSSLWSNPTQLSTYDVVMLPCEGRENRKDNQATQNLIDYTSAGGRVFATHFSYVWIAFAQAPFPSTADWNTARSNPPDPFDVTLDQSFAKGAAFADWLMNVNASTTKGQMSIIESRHNADAVNPAVAQRWFYGTNPNENNASTVQHFTFNTPVAALLPDGGSPEQCGRVVFSDFHVSAAALSGNDTFPASCKNEGLSAQEKALAFMLFDLSNCVQRDEIPPGIN